MTSLLPDTTQYLTRDLRNCHSQRRRNGKVARLPEPLRLKLNQMLDDGIPYKTIIERLGPEGRHLNEDNISNWRLGGYLDYRNAQAINERARTQTEAAADLVRQEGHIHLIHLQRVCGELALLNYIGLIMKHGDQFAREALTKNPAKFITLINACSNMACADIAIRESRWRAEDVGAQASACSNSVQPPASAAPPAACPPAVRSPGEGGTSGTTTTERPQNQNP